MTRSGNTSPFCSRPGIRIPFSVLSRCLGRLRGRLQRSSHSQSDAEAGIDGPGQAEAAGEVEAFRVRIANHVQKAGRSQTSNFGNVIDEPPSDTTLPEVRLEEQSVQ